MAEPRARLASVAGLFLLAATALLGSGCGTDRGGDVLILLDGSTQHGRLDVCSTQACTFDGRSIPRASIRFIGLGGVQPPPPPVESPLRDEVRLLDGSTHGGQVLGVGASAVTTATAAHPRERVAWIHLAHASDEAGGELPRDDLAGTATPTEPGDEASYLWEGTIHAEDTYEGRNGGHRWTGEYTLKFLEVHDASSSRIVPVELRYVIDADTNWDRGSHKLVYDGAHRVVSGDVTMRGRASGTLTADQLTRGRVLSGDLEALSAPAGAGTGIPTSFSSDTQLAEYVGSLGGPGRYRVWIGFLGYGDYRDREAYSPEFARDVRELYRGIERGGLEPLNVPDVNEDFLHWLPRGMPDGIDVFGRLGTPEQSDVRGAFSVQWEGGVSAGQGDPGRFEVSWAFTRTRR